MAAFRASLQRPGSRAGWRRGRLFSALLWPSRGGSSGGVTPCLYPIAPLVFRLRAAGDGSFSALLPLLFTNFHCCESDLELKKKKRKKNGFILMGVSCRFFVLGDRAEEPASALCLGKREAGVPLPSRRLAGPGQEQDDTARLAAPAAACGERGRGRGRAAIGPRRGKGGLALSDGA